MLNKEYIESEFIKAAFQIQKKPCIAELCEVLNSMPTELLRDQGKNLIDVVDALMDELYKDKKLYCRGHQWLSEPLSSISGAPLHFLQIGSMWQDKETSRWHSKGTYHFHLVTEDEIRRELDNVEQAYKKIIKEKGIEHPTVKGIKERILEPLRAKVTVIRNWASKYEND